MTYKNNLPDNCPCSDTENIEESKIFFRVTKNSPPNDSDFIPLWFEKKFQVKSV